MTASIAAETVLMDESLELLSHRIRRRVLTRLNERDPRDEDEIRRIGLAVADDPDALDIELFHNHLPRLADRGFIDWDRNAETARRGPRFHDVDPLIDLMTTYQDELPDGWP